jgi:hypothetical protein
MVKPMTNAIATALASQRLAPVSVVREGRDEQHINAIPKTGAGSTKCAKLYRICPHLPQSVNRSGQVIKGDCEPLWFPRHSSPCVI